MNKSPRSYLVRKLALFLKNTNIGKTTKKNKKQLTIGAEKTRRENLEKLFDGQVCILKHRDCPEQIIMLLRQQKSSVISKALKMNIENDHIPFIPVIPLAFRGLHDLVIMVRKNNKQGFTFLRSVSIVDKVKTLNELYYIYDVYKHNGYSCEFTKRKVRKTNAKYLFSEPTQEQALLTKNENQFRLPLTAVEVIALCVHTDALSYNRHQVWATGSRIANNSSRAPKIYLTSGGRPVLS